MRFMWMQGSMAYVVDSVVLMEVTANSPQRKTVVAVSCCGDSVLQQRQIGRWLGLNTKKTGIHPVRVEMI